VREVLEHREEHGPEQVRDARARGGQPRRVVGGDDAVDAEGGVVDERDERVEPARHRGAPAQGPRVRELVEDEEEQRVGHPVEVVLALRRQEEVLREDPVLGLHLHSLLLSRAWSKQADEGGVGEAGARRWMDGGGE
jgi:hypothetical protein